jgi:3-oxoacyl-[acyl-carrier protein] reductase
MRELESLGTEAEAFKADAARPEEIRGLVERLVARFGKLDILVNNAGIYSMGGLPEISEEEFERVFNVNVRAVFLASRDAARVMARGGRIINVGSVLGQRVPLAGISVYSMSKFAVAGMTRGWARDLAPAGITVNAIQPGPINTELNPETSDFAPVLSGMTALGRYGRPEEVAAAALFLASPEASYITGEMLNVDGGFEA